MAGREGPGGITTIDDGDSMLASIGHLMNMAGLVASGFASAEAFLYAGAAESLNKPVDDDGVLDSVRAAMNRYLCQITAITMELTRRWVALDELC